MTPGRGGLTLAERAALLAGPTPGTPTEDRGVRPPAPGARHCWVVDLPGAAQRRPGLLVEWRAPSAGQWEGRVVYAVEEPGGTVLLEAWLPARHLVPVEPAVEPESRGRGR